MAFSHHLSPSPIYTQHPKKAAKGGENGFFPTIASNSCILHTDSNHRRLFGIHHFRLLCLAVVPESTYANAAVSYSSMVLGKTTVVKRKP